MQHGKSVVLRHIDPKATGRSDINQDAMRRELVHTRLKETGAIGLANGVLMEHLAEKIAEYFMLQHKLASNASTKEKTEWRRQRKHYQEEWLEVLRRGSRKGHADKILFDGLFADTVKSDLDERKQRWWFIPDVDDARAD